MLRTHVIGAVFKRNVASYFSGVLGYLFIVVFVIAGALAAFRAEFFSHNLANLDQLSEYFPYLLLFLVPAITMTAWAEERKLGTDELLFTLPATDLEVILGKYLSVLAVYTIALGFSMTHSLVLAWLGSTNSFWNLSWLGSPDWGMLLTTYFGYWLAGAALLSAGMFASSLTSSATVAFVAGVVICGVPVFMDRIPHLPDALEQLTLREQFSDFAMGVVPLSGLLYFVSLTAFMLYLNVVMIGRRHWSTIDSQAPPVWLEGCVWLAAGGGFITMYVLQPEGMWYDIALCAFAAITLYTLFAFLLGPAPGRHYAGRVVALAAVLISWNYMATRVDARLDMTEEHLFTLSETTDEVLEEIPEDRTVMIDAYISPDVPDEYQEVRRQLLGLLRQIDRRGGSKVRVRVVNVEPYSELADEASNWGIVARPVQWEREGRFLMEDIYLGAVVRGADEVVIPFFDLGNSVEYELTRSIGTVSQEERMTVGILTTDAKVMGGFDMQTFQSQPEWRIAEELKKQYDVEEVSPDSAINADDFDVLIAVLPSSLTEPQMANFVDYVQSGGATLIFDDPVPRVMVQNAPLREKPRQGGGQMGFQGYSEPKADGGRLTTLLDTIKCAWERHRPGDVDAGGNPEPAGVDFIVLDAFNPHPEFSDVLGPEWVFVTAESGVETALNPNSPVTSGLQEVMTMFPGSIRPRANSELEFTPLLRSSTRLSGLTDWDELISDMPFFGPQIVSNPRYRVDDDSHVIAARIQSDEDADQARNVIFVCDTDMISDFMFRIQEQQLYDLRIDNTTFVLNAVDVLAGNTAYLELRNRRPAQHRLRRVEARKQSFQEELNREIDDAEQQAKERLEEAQDQLDAKVEAIENDPTLDEIQRERAKAIAVQERQRLLDLEQDEIEREKEQKIRTLRAQTEREIREIENGVWGWAVFLPALPAIVLGAVVLLIRLMNEQSTISPDRLVRR
jgi:ABC-2 type transport system permease protein